MRMIQNLKTVWMSLTYNCNNQCEWCYTASNISKNQNKNMPFGKSLDIINFLSHLDTQKIILIGGEPTLHENLEKILMEIKEKEIKVGIISNGRKFKNSDFTKRIKKTGVDYLSISITSPDAETHDKITHVKGSFYETIKGIYTACEEGIKVSTNTVIALDNVNQLEKMVDLLKKEPIEEMTFNICGVCVSNESNNSQILYPSESIKAFEKVYSYAKSQGVKTKLVTPMPLCLFDSELIIELKEKKLVTGGPCQLSYGKNLVVEYNGDIVPCTHLAHFPLLNIFSNGNIISKDEFIKEYNDVKKIPYLFRKQIKRYPSTKCNDDNCNEPCAGGCPIFWTKFNPEKEIKGMKT